MCHYIRRMMEAGKFARLTIWIEMLIFCNNKAKDCEQLSWPTMLISSTLSLPPPHLFFSLCLLSLPHIKFRKPPEVISLLCFPKSGNLQIIRTKLEHQEDNFIWKLNPAFSSENMLFQYIWESKKITTKITALGKSFLVVNLPECMLML